MVRAESGAPEGASGHVGQRAARVPGPLLLAVVAALATLAAAWLLAVSAAQAQPSAGAGCSAVLEGALEDELLARIRGQSQDVACALVAGELRAEADAVLAIARAAGGGYTLTVRVRADGSSHVRNVPATGGEAGDALARSAAFEAVALVVRGELLELARAREARAAQQSQRAEGPGPDERAPKLAAPVADEADDGADAPEAHDDDDSYDGPGRGAVGVGWQLQAIGVSEPGHAVAARAVLVVGPVELGLAGAFGFGAPLEDAYVRAQIRRHALMGVLALPLLRGDRVRFELGAGVGALLFARELTELRDPTLLATRDETQVAFAIGVEAALELRLLGPLGLRAALAADAVPAAPRYVYELDGARVEGAAPWYLQPRGGVGVVVRLP